MKSNKRPIIAIASRSIPDPLSSFDFNGVRSRHIQAIAAAGGVPVLVPLTDDIEIVSAVYEIASGVLLTGGGDVDPARYGEQPGPHIQDSCGLRDSAEIWLAARAFNDRKPILGICRGAHVLNVALGGTLYQDLPTGRPDTAVDHGAGIPQTLLWTELSHSVRLTPDSRLARLLGAEEIVVNSLHHQAVKTLGQGLRATGLSPDGVIEVTEAGEEQFAIGVQCHPEFLYAEIDPRWGSVFKELVKSALSFVRS